MVKEEEIYISKIFFFVRICNEGFIFNCTVSQFLSQSVHNVQLRLVK
jgi:hypothetical protein